MRKDEEIKSSYGLLRKTEDVDSEDVNIARIIPATEAIFRVALYARGSGKTDMFRY